MEKTYREQIIENLINLIDTREIIFTQIINLAMGFELKHLEETFEVGDVFSFSISLFETVEDENVKKLIKLHRQVNTTIFDLMNANGIDETEILEQDQ